MMYIVSFVVGTLMGCICVVVYAVVAGIYPNQDAKDWERLQEVVIEATRKGLPVRLSVVARDDEEDE